MDSVHLASTHYRRDHMKGNSLIVLWQEVTKLTTQILPIPGHMALWREVPHTTQGYRNLIKLGSGPYLALLCQVREDSNRIVLSAKGHKAIEVPGSYMFFFT